MIFLIIYSAAGLILGNLGPMTKKDCMEIEAKLTMLEISKPRSERNNFKCDQKKTRTAVRE